MKTIWSGVCIAIAGGATAVLTAQAPAPPQNPSAADQKDQKVTVTGCLKEAPASATAAVPPNAPTAAGTAGTAGTTGATGTTGAANDPAAGQPKFVLTEASTSSAASTDSSAAAGATTTTPGAAPSGTRTYRLIANPTALAPHVGKKLELIGTLEAAANPSSDTAAGPEAAAPMLRVQSGKIVGATCSE